MKTFQESPLPHYPPLAGSPTWVPGASWTQSTTLANETTGYFKNAVYSVTFPTGSPIPVGPTTTTAFKYVV
jgi:hypothetical protein